MVYHSSVTAMMQRLSWQSLQACRKIARLQIIFKIIHQESPLLFYCNGKIDQAISLKTIYSSSFIHLCISKQFLFKVNKGLEQFTI